jgi:hypothetical protein
MKLRFSKLIGATLLVCFFVVACGATPAAPTATLPPPTATQPPAATTVPATNTAIPATPIPSPTSTPEPTLIKHVTKPGEPVYISSQTTIDCTIGRTFVSNLPVVIPPACDNQALDYIERPVTADTKDYVPYLDIGQAKFGANSDWIFASIVVYDATEPKGAGDVYYFFKLDLNLDGRNSNVVVFSVKNLPLDTLNWTVNGVQAWSNVEGTVSPIFDQGVGADPDLIWVRRSTKAIEFAFKPALINGTNRFDWWAWAYQGTLTPTDLSLSPIPTDLFQIDNTCAWGFNVSSTNLVNTCRRN